VIVARDDVGIVGFYSLSMFTLSLSDLPPDIAKRLTRYPEVPAALVGRLARAERARGTGIGIGELLLADAVRRVLSAARSVAAFAILVDAKDERASGFYRGFGFIPFPTRPTRLFLMTSTTAEAFSRV